MELAEKVPKITQILSGKMEKNSPGERKEKKLISFSKAKNRKLWHNKELSESYINFKGLKSQLLEQFTLY